MQQSFTHFKSVHCQPKANTRLTLYAPSQVPSCYQPAPHDENVFMSVVAGEISEKHAQGKYQKNMYKKEKQWHHVLLIPFVAG